MQLTRTKFRMPERTRPCVVVAAPVQTPETEQSTIMKFTHVTMRPIVHKLMVEMGLLGRPATPDEIVKIVQAVLAEAEGRKPEPLAPKLVVLEDAACAEPREN